MIRTRCTILCLLWMGLLPWPSRADEPAYQRADAKRFAAKVFEAVGLVCESYVEEVKPGSRVAGAVRGLYQKLAEKIPPALEARLKRSGEMTEAELITLLADARERLGRRKQLDQQRDLDIALSEMLGPLAPRCGYISDPPQFGSGPSASVGLYLRAHKGSDTIEVVTPIYGGPTYRAGIRAGDRILTITRKDKAEGEGIEQLVAAFTKGMPLAEAVKRLSGPDNSTIWLTVQAASGAWTRQLELRRAQAPEETVLGSRRKADDGWDHWLDADRKIGYVRLTAMGSKTASTLEGVVHDLERQGAKGLILDLRSCPGGLLEAAIQCADLFVGKERIVTIRGRTIEEEYSGKRDTPSKLRLACLIGGKTASAGEILAAALQDHRRAIVVGDRSMGRASVQNLFNFDDGLLKITAATFLRPTGKNLNKPPRGKTDDLWGVIPDRGFVVNLSPKERDELAEHLNSLTYIHRKRPEKPAVFTDRQLQKAAEYFGKKR